MKSFNLILLVGALAVLALSQNVHGESLATCVTGSDWSQDPVAADFVNGFLQFLPHSVYSYDNVRSICYQGLEDSTRFDFDGDVSIPIGEERFAFRLNGTVIVNHNSYSPRTVNVSLNAL